MNRLSLNEKYELIDDIKGHIQSLGFEAYQDWLYEQDDEFREEIFDLLADPLFALEPHQRMPDGDWRIWQLKMGRGAGKTHAASTNCHVFALDWFPGGQGILVGATVKDVRDTMIEGDSGLLATAPDGVEVHYNKHENIVRWPNGSSAIIRTADNPEDIRGPTLLWGWADELVKWRSETSFDNLMRCIRNCHERGTRLILTTTPKRTKQWLREIPQRLDAGIVITSTGSTLLNRHLDPSFLAAMSKDVTSARAREEVLGEDLEVDGDLWNSDNLNQHRVDASLAPEVYAGTCQTRFLSIDPSQGKRDETGILLCGEKRSNRQDNVHIIKDCSTKANIGDWTDEVITLAKNYLKNGSRDYLLLETNGHAGTADLIKLKLGNAGLRLRVIEVNVGNKSKWQRAQEAFVHFELGRVVFYGFHDELERQLKEWEPEMAHSPDRGDAFTQAVRHVCKTKAVRLSPFLAASRQF